MGCTGLLPGIVKEKQFPENLSCKGTDEKDISFQNILVDRVFLIDF
jgi:hypothetical protein